MSTKGTKKQMLNDRTTAFISRVNSLSGYMVLLKAEHVLNKGVKLKRKTRPVQTLAWVKICLLGRQIAKSKKGP